MKIESSAMSLSASSAQSKTHSVTEQLNAWAGTQQEESAQAPANESLSGIFESGVIFSSSTDEELIFEIPQADRDKINLLSKVIESLTGKK